MTDKDVIESNMRFAKAVQAVQALLRRLEDEAAAQVPPLQNKINQHTLRISCETTGILFSANVL